MLTTHRITHGATSWTPMDAVITFLVSLRRAITHRQVTVFLTQAQHRDLISVLEEAIELEKEAFSDDPNEAQGHYITSLEEMLEVVKGS